MDPKFPYYYLFVEKQNIIQDFEHLSKMRLKKSKSERSSDPGKSNKVEEKKLLTMEYSKNKILPYVKITDYFSERCRVKCTFGGLQSPLQYFERNYDKLARVDFEDYWDFNEYMTKKNRGCNNFVSLVALEIYRLFKPTAILDFSAGWGDRLIAALAYGRAEYTGVDPSKCMKPRYKEIINFFTTYCSHITGLKDKYRVINKAFEDHRPKQEHYDLVFTSPPFFDYEVYERDNKNQSVDRYQSLESWKYNFMFPALENSLYALKPGGHLALYIEDYKGHQYVGAVKKKMTDLGGNQFVGVINWTNTDRPKPKIRYTYVWKKE